MTSLISMILVLPYQNDYRSRRVTDVEEHFVVIDLYAQTCVFREQHLQFSIWHSKPSESLSSLCASHLLLTLQIPWHCSDFSVHRIAGPQNLFKSRVPTTLASFHLILTQISLHLCIRMEKFIFCTEHSRYCKCTIIKCPAGSGDIC